MTRGLRLVRSNFSPHRYSIVRLTDDGRETLRSSPPARGTWSQDGRARRAQQDWAKEVRDDLPRADDVPNARYGAWVLTESHLAEWDHVTEQARLDALHDQALGWLDRQKTKRERRAAIDDAEFDDVWRHGDGEGSEIGQRFRVTHEDGTTHEGVVKSLFDAGTIVTLDRHDRAAWAVEREGDGLTDAEQDVVKYVRHASDVPKGVRM